MPLSITDGIQGYILLGVLFTVPYVLSWLLMCSDIVAANLFFSCTLDIGKANTFTCSVMYSTCDLGTVLQLPICALLARGPNLFGRPG